MRRLERAVGPLLRLLFCRRGLELSLLRMESLGMIRRMLRSIRLLRIRMFRRKGSDGAIFGLLLLVSGIGQFMNDCY